MGDQKGFPWSSLLRSLLSCCQASNFILPRVSRTDDVIIIDRIENNFLSFLKLAESDGFYIWIQLMARDMMSHFKAKISTAKLLILDSFRCHRSILTQWCFASSNCLVDGIIRSPILVPLILQVSHPISSLMANMEKKRRSTLNKNTATCGTAPTVMPTARGLISERLVGAANAKNGGWSFMVSLFEFATWMVFCGLLIVVTRTNHHLNI